MIPQNTAALSGPRAKRVAPRATGCTPLRFHLFSHAIRDGSAWDFNLLAQVAKQAVEAAQDAWLAMLKATEPGKPGTRKRDVLHLLPLELLAIIQLVVMRLPEPKNQRLSLQAVGHRLVKTAAMHRQLLGKGQGSALAVVGHELAGCKPTLKVSPTVREVQRT